MKWVAFIVCVLLGLVEFAMRVLLVAFMIVSVIGLIVIAAEDRDLLAPRLWTLAGKVL